MPAIKKSAIKKKATKKKSSAKKKLAPKKNRNLKYRIEFVEQVYKLCLLGAVDKEIANFFNIAESTLNLWKKDYPEFLDSMQRGKLIADADVAEKLFQRATGYSHDDVHITNYMGDITQTDVKKHYPPDTTAARYWLNNRTNGKWRDRQEITGDPDRPLQNKWTVEFVNATPKSK